jgi:hypothetical protein
LNRLVLELVVSVRLTAERPDPNFSWLLDYLEAGCLFFRSRIGALGTFSFHAEGILLIAATTVLSGFAKHVVPVCIRLRRSATLLTGIIFQSLTIRKMCVAYVPAAIINGREALAATATKAGRSVSVLSR